MLLSNLTLKMVGLASIITSVSALGLFSTQPLNAASSDAIDQASNQLIAYENMCEQDELMVGDEVTIEDETYVLEEDEDGLFIEYILVDEEGEDTGAGVGTYSLTEFGDDCETVTFEAVEGTDSIIGNDVDEE